MRRFIGYLARLHIRTAESIRWLLWLNKAINDSPLQITDWGLMIQADGAVRQIGWALFHIPYNDESAQSWIDLWKERKWRN